MDSTRSMTREEAVRVACADPGRFVSRKFAPDHTGRGGEALYLWQARAVLAALDALDDDEPRRNRALIKNGPA